MKALFDADWQQQLERRKGAATSLSGAEGAAAKAVDPPGAADEAADSPGPFLSNRVDGHEDVDDAASSVGGSEGSWRDMSGDEVMHLLSAPISLKDESLVVYERRIARAQRILQVRHLAIPLNIAMEVKRARDVAQAAEAYRGSTGETLLQNDMDAALDEDDDKGDKRVDLLLEVAQLYGRDVRSTLRGAAPTSLGAEQQAGAAQRASTPSPSKVLSAGPSPTRNLAEPLDDAASTASHNFAKELVDLLRAAGGGGGQRSTIQIKPDVTWPKLADNDQDIDSFFEELEDVCGLANDAKGMSDLERLRCLGNCLQQSRKKVYRVILKETRRSGLLRTDPGAVYETIRGRLMEFRETLLEKQNRVEGEYHNLSKGSLSALQFLPLFEAVTSEMDLSGVGLSERQLLLGYLRKVGKDYRAEILKDRRLYKATSGGEQDQMRGAQNWREAHRILLEMESVSAGTKALVAAVDGGPTTAPGLGKRAKKKAAAAAKNSPGINAVETSTQICYRARDQGTCDRQGCQYDHTPAKLAAARKERSARESGQKGSKGGGKGKGGKDKGGKQGGGGSNAKPDPKIADAKAKGLCIQYIQGLCKRPAGECKFSHAAKQINAIGKAFSAAADKGLVTFTQKGSQQQASPAAAAVAPSPPPGIEKTTLDPSSGGRDLRWRQKSSGGGLSAHSSDSE